MQLPEWTEQNAADNADFREEMSHERHLATRIVEDVFETFLEREELYINDPERDQNGESATNLWGAKYDILVADVEQAIRTKLEEL